MDIRMNKKYTALLEKVAPATIIIFILIFLIPVLRDRVGRHTPITKIEPPKIDITFKTGYSSLDSLLNEGLEEFRKGNYISSSRNLSKAHFYLSVKLKEGELSELPEGLLFYLSLSEFYRGKIDKAAKLLEEECSRSPEHEVYSWYLANIYIQQGEKGKARKELEHVISFHGEYEEKAREILTRL